MIAHPCSHAASKASKTTRPRRRISTPERRRDLTRPEHTGAWVSHRGALRAHGTAVLWEWVQLPTAHTGFYVAVIGPRGAATTCMIHRSVRRVYCRRRLQVAGFALGRRRSFEWPKTAPCRRWPTTRRMGEDAPEAVVDRWQPGQLNSVKGDDLFFPKSVSAHAARTNGLHRPATEVRNSCSRQQHHSASGSSTLMQ